MLEKYKPPHPPPSVSFFGNFSHSISNFPSASSGLTHNPFTPLRLQTSFPIPTYPIIFSKPLTSLSGPHSPIPIPPIALEAPGLDYECELVIVIGRSGTNIPAPRALAHVLGYAVGNDVSHREWQLRRGGGQWALGKGFDGWAPFGPGIVTGEALYGEEAEGKGPQDLRIGTRVNGEVKQDSSTGGMIFGVKEIVAFLSRGQTLLAGDVIFTGT